MNKIKWTRGKVNKLTRLWNEGKTGTEIATALGCEFTRNAVIGKAYRLNLSPRPSPLLKTKNSGILLED